MASGGSSGRNNSASKGFDFASDDILCSYDDFANQEAANGSHSDPSIASNSAKEFHKSRMARPSFPAASYSPPEESINQDVVVAVERSMKKYSDNLMRFLEGLSSRMSQLELYCYNLDKSIGEMRSDLGRDHGEADTKLRSLEKHLQEVHRSVQILRDKQELAETQKELAKLQLAQKESSPSSQKSDGRSTPPPSSEPQKSENTSDSHGQQLALALPHQVAPQPTLPTRPTELPQPPMPSQALTQPQAYYLPPTQLPSLPAPSQHSQGQYLPSESQYRTQQPAQSQVNQPQAQPQLQPPPQYQQQWAPQPPQQMAPQQPMQPPQPRPSSAPAYPTYLSNQPSNPSPQETLPGSMPMQMSYSGIPQPNSTPTMPYGYSGPGRTMTQQPPPQHLKPSFIGQPGDGYGPGGPVGPPGGPHPTLSPGTYMMYESEGGRSQHQTQPPHFQQSSFPPNPQQSSGNIMVRPPQFMRNHPYNELIDKLVSMGYRGDHVTNVIQRLEESGQPVDFNAVLDRLNGQSSGSSQRGWSG